MSTHNICFYEEMAEIIFQLSSNTRFICSSGKLWMLSGPEVIKKFFMLNSIELERPIVLSVI